jgi:hypothetical protein
MTTTTIRMPQRTIARGLGRVLVGFGSALLAWSEPRERSADELAAVRRRDAYVRAADLEHQRRIQRTRVF